MGFVFIANNMNFHYKQNPEKSDDQIFQNFQKPLAIRISNF